MRAKYRAAHVCRKRLQGTRGLGLGGRSYMRSSRWLVLAALIAAGCGGSSGGSSGNGGGNGKPIKIGASLPLTGDFSEPGKAAQQGYKVWESLTNSKGGLLGRKVQIVVKDDASNQNT